MNEIAAVTVMTSLLQILVSRFNTKFLAKIIIFVTHQARIPTLPFPHTYNTIPPCNALVSTDAV